MITEHFSAPANLSSRFRLTKARETWSSRARRMIQSLSTRNLRNCRLTFASGRARWFAIGQNALASLRETRTQN
jgi:hypothetical protein